MSFISISPDENVKLLHTPLWGKNGLILFDDIVQLVDEFPAELASFQLGKISPEAKNGLY